MKTNSAEEFLSCVYRLHRSWSNDWEHRIREGSIGKRQIDALSDLVSEMNAARANMRAEGVRMPRDLDAVVQQFLTSVGELDAFMPRALEAITLRGRGADYQSAVEKALKIGSECAKLADEVGPKLREAFPWRDEP